MRRRNGILVAAAALLTLVGCAAAVETTPQPTTSSIPEASAPGPTETPEAPVSGDTPITITAGDTVLTATLNDTQVSQDLIAMLPVTLSWYRNFGIEYITELDAPLTEEGPFYTDVQPGDLVYYNPMDSLTIIYEETSSVPTLTLMGKITSDLEAFRNLPNDVDFTMELAD